jgi:hypothetical protein
VRTQRDRQRGRLNVAGALIVANCFEQPAERLALLSAEFLADTGVPMAFLEVDTLLEMIRWLTNAPLARNTLRWSQIFCRGGLVKPEVFRSELRAATRETYPR